MNLRRAIQKAIKVSREVDLSTLDEDGTWIGIYKNWDVNVFIDPETGKRQATLYPVKDGNTITNGIHYNLTVFFKKFPGE